MFDDNEQMAEVKQAVNNNQGLLNSKSDVDDAFDSLLFVLDGDLNALYAFAWSRRIRSPSRRSGGGCWAARCHLFCFTPLSAKHSLRPRSRISSTP
jgi:hypothetical protein